MQTQSFSELIQTARRAANYSLADAARLLPLPAATLERVEQDTEPLPERLLEPLAELYRLPLRKVTVAYHTDQILQQLQSTEYAAEILRHAQRRLKHARRRSSVPADREAIFASLRDYFAQQPVERAYVFGSFARSAAVSKDSDLDILVAFKKPNRLTLFDLMHMKEELAKRTGRAIDLVEEGRELDALRGNIERDKVLVYAH